MTIETTRDTNIEVPVKESRRDHLAQTPVVGRRLAQVHDAATVLRPTDEDTKATVVAKRAGQGALIVGAAALMAVVIL